MTELIIDGIHAVLPKDFAIQVKRENPLITKNGEYTYEITLQLTNPTNAELYKHLNRLNSTQEVATKRPAILLADNRVYCNGTEIITGWTDDTVSIQIASGNSELNYFIGSSLQIEFLKMRSTVPGFDGGEASGTQDLQKYIQQVYPEVDYCLAPVFDQSTGNMHNQWSIRTDGSILDNEMLDVTPQPYLCAYIKELLNALGYELTENQLENTVYKDLYLCHIEPTHKWNEMLPGWSVKGFLEQVEQLFNAVFLVDNRRRTARLLLRSSYFSGNTGVHVQQVEDVYEAEIEEPETEDPTTSNVQYKVDDCEFWRWNILPEAVKKGAKRDTIPATVSTGIRGITGWFGNTDHQRTDTIYKHATDGKEYVFLRNWVNENGQRESPVFVMADRFAGLDRKDAANTLELEMVPVAFQSCGITFYGGGGRGDDTVIYVSIPSISGRGTAEHTEPSSIEEQIQNNAGDGASSKRNICLALYTGVQSLNMSFNGVGLNYPLPYIDEFRQVHLSNGETYWTYNATNSIGASLRPATLDSLLYQTAYNIDYTRAIKVRSHDPNVYAVNLVFEIRNKRYICKEIEYTIDADGRKGAWTGTFYPIRISDTEADLRWILADGKWRDGGVWLDNGRWLDE